MRRLLEEKEHVISVGDASLSLVYSPEQRRYFRERGLRPTVTGVVVKFYDLPKMLAARRGKEVDIDPYLEIEKEARMFRNRAW